MLGRYVAGTVLVLGVAMLMAPPSPEREDRPGTEAPRTKPAPVEATSATVAPVPAEPDIDTAEEAEPAEMKAGIEDAVAAALALDSAEAAEAAEGESFGAETGSAEPNVQDETPTQVTDAVPLADQPTATPAAQTPEQTADQATEQASDQNDTQTLPVAQDGPEPVVLYVIGNAVNVRAGPSTEYRVVGSVSRGESVELLGSEDGWAQILFGNQQFAGFMSRQFLDYEPGGG